MISGRRKDILVGADDDCERGLAQLQERAENAKRDASVIEQVAEDVRRLITVGGATADALFVLGYVLYLHPDRVSSQQLRDSVDEALRASLKLDAHDFRAWLYLGHNAYDFRDFEGAARYFSDAAARAPRSYLGLKAFEMLTCATLVQGRMAEATQALAALVSQAEGLPREDLWPRELVAALSSTSLSNVDSDVMEELVRLGSRVDELGGLNRWVSEAIEHARARS
jgi:hypothetical protein